MKKYEITSEQHPVNPRLRRIRALIDIEGVVKTGELGGYLEHEGNLSHEEACWVSGDAQVYGYARVYGNAVVSGDESLMGPCLLRTWNSRNGHGSDVGYGSPYTVPGT